MEQHTKEQRLKDMTCPQCKKGFVLRWDNYGSSMTADLHYESATETLTIRACPSGGVYDVSIKCPHCNYEEEL